MFGKNRLKFKRADPDELIYADVQTAPASGKRRGGNRRLAAALAVLAVALTVVVGILLLGLALRGRENRYVRAGELMAGKDYEEAALVLEDLGDYRDSRILLEELARQEQAYAAAEDLLAQRRYEEAAVAFRALGDYADSARMANSHVTYQKALDLLAETDAGSTQLLTRILADGVKLTDERSYPTIVGYEAAAALLESLGDYEGAPALLDRCYYSAALVKLGWEDWNGALAYMEKMTGETAADFYREYQQLWNEKNGEGR